MEVVPAEAQQAAQAPVERPLFDVPQAPVAQFDQLVAAVSRSARHQPHPGLFSKTTRHRLNRGGDRQPNAALHRSVVTRMHWHQPTKAYVAQRTAEGKTMRCLKRLARQVYRALPSGNCPPPPQSRKASKAA